MLSIFSVRYMPGKTVLGQFARPDYSIWDHKILTPSEFLIESFKTQGKGMRLWISCSCTFDFWHLIGDYNKQVYFIKLSVWIINLDSQRFANI